MEIRCTPSTEAAAPGLFAAAVERVVNSLRPGEVVTYGEVAREVGRPGAARAVGRVLALSGGLPWWRVVRSDGSLPIGDEQARRLQAEGVEVSHGRVRWPRRRRRGGARPVPGPFP